MKGWYGDRQQHSMASRGMRSKGIEHRAGYPDFPKYRVGVVDDSGRDDYIFFENEKDAYELFIEFRGEGKEAWYGEFDENEEDYETVQSYDPDLDEDDNYWDEMYEARKIAYEFDVCMHDKYVRELIQLYADNNINETTLRDRLYEYESEITSRGEPEKEYKDFNPSAKIGIDKFVKLNTKEMDEMFLKFEQETGMRATNINNKERFYSWVSRELRGD